MGKQVGNFIRQLRISKGLSQSDVAKKLNLKTAQSISNIERGISPLPRAKIKQLAGILGVEKTKIVDMVLVEVQGRYSKAVGGAAGKLGSKAKGLEQLSTEEHELVGTLVERFRKANDNERAQIKKKLQRLF